jgi:hypothetical protein
MDGKGAAKPESTLPKDQIHHATVSGLNGRDVRNVVAK